MKQVGTLVVPASNEQRHTKGTHTTRLGVLLHDLSDTLHQLSRGDRLVVDEKVLLGNLSRTFHQQSIVWTHATVDHANMIGDLLHLENTMLLGDDRLLLLLGGQHHTVHRFDAHRRGARGHGRQGILDLHQFARWTTIKPSNNINDIHYNHNQIITYLKVVSEKL